jgi:hypothetical protein
MHGIDDRKHLGYVGETWYESNLVGRPAQQKELLCWFPAMLEENERDVVEVVTEVVWENGQTICEVVGSDGEFVLEEASEIFLGNEEVTCGE